MYCSNPYIMTTRNCLLWWSHSFCWQFLVSPVTSSPENVVSPLLSMILIPSFLDSWSLLSSLGLFSQANICFYITVLWNFSIWVHYIPFQPKIVLQTTSKTSNSSHNRCSLFCLPILTTSSTMGQISVFHHPVAFFLNLCHHTTGS